MMTRFSVTVCRTELWLQSRDHGNTTPATGCSAPVFETELCAIGVVVIYSDWRIRMHAAEKCLAFPTRGRKYSHIDKPNQCSSRPPRLRWLMSDAVLKASAFWASSIHGWRYVCTFTSIYEDFFGFDRQSGQFGVDWLITAFRATVLECLVQAAHIEKSGKLTGPLYVGLCEWLQSEQDRQQELSGC